MLVYIYTKSFIFTKMPETSERATRSKTASETDEALIQRVIEKILINTTFMEKLFGAVKEIIVERDKYFEDMRSKTETALMSLEDRLDQQEQYSRLNSLRIYGVPEAKNEETDAVVVDLCASKLNINVSRGDIDCCHRLKSREGTQRPIIVKFCRRLVRNEVFSKKKQLKGSKIVIREDLTGRRAAIIKDLVKKVGTTNVFTLSANIFVKVNNKIHKIKNISEYKNFTKDLQAQQL